MTDEVDSTYSCYLPWLYNDYNSVQTLYCRTERIQYMV